MPTARRGSGGTTPGTAATDAAFYDLQALYDDAHMALLAAVRTDLGVPEAEAEGTQGPYAERRRAGPDAAFDDDEDEGDSDAFAVRGRVASRDRVGGRARRIGTGVANGPDCLP